jgi:hypothetical protein
LSRSTYLYCRHHPLLNTLVSINVSLLSIPKYRHLIVSVNVSLLSTRIYKHWIFSIKVSLLSMQIYSCV